jgi:hypothetical protein
MQLGPAVKRYLDVRLAEGAARESIRKELTTLRAALREAVALGWMTKSQSIDAIPDFHGAVQAPHEVAHARGVREASRRARDRSRGRGRIPELAGNCRDSSSGRQGFLPYRVSYWRAKFAAPDRQGPHLRSDSGGFVPVAVRDAIQRHEAATKRRVEVTLANGRVVTFAGTWEAAAITPWLHALEGER